MNAPSRFRRLFATPLVLAVFTAGGLLSALLGNGVWDALSWLCLGVPVVAVAMIIFRSKR